MLGSLLLKQGYPAGLLVAAVAVGICGVALIVWTPGGAELRPLGVLLALLAAVAYAGYFTAGDHLIHRTGPMTASLWTSATAGTCLAIFTITTGAERMPHWNQWAMLFGLGLLTAGAFYCLFRGLRRLGAVKVSALGTIEPLTTTALAILILGDRPGVGFAIGTPLIVGGAIIASLARAR